MAANADWSIQVDLDGDGDFDEPEEDLTGDAWEWSVQTGFTQAYQPIAMAERVQVVLRNLDSRYSPEHANALAGFTRGRLLRIQSTFDATTRTMALLWTGVIEPEIGQYTGVRTRLNGESYFERARKRQATVGVQTAKRGGELIEALVTGSGLYPPAYTLDPGNWGDLDDGQTLFPFAFDGGAGDLYQALRDVAASEATPARVFVGRDGRLHFWERHRFVASEAAATIDNSMFDMDYSFGDEVYDRVRVKFNPRRLEDSGPYELGRLDSATKVYPGLPVTVTLRYDDGSGYRISTSDPIDPAAGVDWVARTEEAGGADVTATFSVTPTHLGNASDWLIENNGAQVGWVQAGATQRGNDKLVNLGQAEVVAGSGDREMPWQAPLMANAHEARDLADYLLDTFGAARGLGRVVTFAPQRSAELMEIALALTTGDRIRLIENKTGQDTDYLIVGTKHDLKKAGTEHRMSWFLEPTGGWENFIQFDTDDRGFDGPAYFGY